MRKSVFTIRDSKRKETAPGNSVSKKDICADAPRVFKDQTGKWPR